MLQSKVRPQDKVKMGTFKKGELYQSDYNETDTVVLCTEDESDGRVQVVVLRDASTKSYAKTPGDSILWAVSRLRPFVGHIELSN